MEIQTFLIAKEIQPIGNGAYNAQLIGLHNFFPINNQYPFEFTVPFYLLMRRENDKQEEVVTLRFNLLNSDGRYAGEPKDLYAEGIFPKNHNFMPVAGTIKFVVPAAGDYRLDIVADENKMDSLYSYNLEIRRK